MPRRIPTNCAPQEPPYPKSGLVDLRWEASLWLLMSVKELEAKLKAEDRRRRTGHWTYDANRHQMLIETVRLVKAKNS